MATIYPFKGYRYDPTQVGQIRDVVTQPYDKIPDALKEEYLPAARLGLCLHKQIIFKFFKSIKSAPRRNCINRFTGSLKFVCWKIPIGISNSNSNNYLFIIRNITKFS